MNPVLMAMAIFLWVMFAVFMAGMGWAIHMLAVSHDVRWWLSIIGCPIMGTVMFGYACLFWSLR